VRLAADANVLLAAVLGGRARLVLDHPEVEEVVTTTATFAEITEYAPILGRKKKISPDILMLAVASLPVTIVEQESFEPALAEARQQIEWRDPDDIAILALALHRKIPLWSKTMTSKVAP
jgi:predicted nucleic acid-binding protein